MIYLKDIVKWEPLVGETRLHFIVQSEQPSQTCLLYTSPSPRDRQKSRMPSSA